MADSEPLTHRMDGGEMGVALPRVFGAGERGVEEEIVARFQIEKTRGGGKVECDFRGIGEVEKQHLVPAGREHRETGFERFHRRQQIGDQHHEAALADEFRDAF